ncbi:hypothetical protein HPULCUR_007467 [Helicostylum pulchrum]|uniref:Uncharacterized protein n=1 Tax=Helicostylum pulchrum TaxID=562976 RepID=A0ABP9Y4V5_9FUNG
MTLSPKEILAPPRSGITPDVSYADAVAKNKKFITTTKRSLIDQQPIILEPTANIDSQIIQSRVWRHSLYQNGYILEISKIKDLSDYSSNFHGVKFFGKPTERYMELYPNNDIPEKFKTEGIFYEHLNTRLIPCKALEDIPLIEKTRNH